MEVLDRVCSQTRSFVLSNGTPSLLPTPNPKSFYSGPIKGPMVLKVSGYSALQTLYHNILNEFRGKVEIKELAVGNFIFRPHVKFLPFEF
jgi:hypothetical protein